MDTRQKDVTMHDNKQLQAPEVKKRGRPKKIKEEKSVSVFPLKDYSKTNIAGGGFLLSDKKQTKKIRLLWYGDSPTANTGFGCVTRNILEQLQKTELFEITVLAIQFYEDPEVDLHKRWELPYRIIAAGNNHDRDMFGRRKLLSLIKNEPFDLIITFQDLPNLELSRFGLSSIRSAIEEAKNKFYLDTKWIIYTPIDGQLKRFELKPIKDSDMTILYTKFGYSEVIRVISEEARTKTEEVDLQRILVNELNKKLCFIYHGIDTKKFYPIKREKLLQFRKEYFNLNPEDLLIINVNRNQQRKLLAHTIEAFLMARKKHNNFNLYLHCRREDVGGRLGDIIEAYGNPPGITIPENFDVIKGVDEKILNKIYNCADLYITTTLGEGWGLTVTEAMACKVPTIIPPHSALHEIGEKGRAVFTQFSGNTIIHEDFYRLRPVVDTVDMAQKIEAVLCQKNEPEIQNIINNAYHWVTKLTWDKIGQEWLARIMQVLGR